jgi:anti-anti-sigma factor
MASLSTMPRTGEFLIGVTRLGDTRRVVRVSGALDRYSAGEAKAFLVDQLRLRPKSVVLDVSEAFVDSSGIGVLAWVAQRARMQRVLFKVVGAAQLGQVLRLNRLDELISLADTIGSAAGASVHQLGPTRGDHSGRLRSVA